MQEVIEEMQNEGFSDEDIADELVSLAENCE